MSTIRPTQSLYKLILALAFVAGQFVPQASASAQTYGTDFHTMTVTVATITAIQVNSGIVNLTIAGSGVTAGQDQMTVVDQTTSLLWGVNSSTKKITVASSLATPLYTLKVLAVNPTQGLAASEVTLTTVAADFLLNIGRSSGTCTLQYTGVALASQGMGSDAHTITFTISNQ